MEFSSRIGFFCLIDGIARSQSLTPGIGYSPTAKEMQCRAGSRQVFSASPIEGCFMLRKYFCVAMLALSFLPPALAQEVSLNARLLAYARAGDEAGVKRAIAEGAAVNARNRVGETVLVIALKSDRPGMALQMIDAGTDVNVAAVNGVTPLMAAAHGGYVEVARVLLAKGADVTAVDQLKK